MPNLTDAEAAFENNPEDGNAFDKLRRAYENDKDFGKLVGLYERRAQRLDAPEKAAEIYFQAAELCLDKLKDVARAEPFLRTAVARDPKHPKAADRLAALYQSTGRLTEYADLLAARVAALEAAQPGAKGLGVLHLELGTLQEEHFGRIDRAMEHYQAAFKLDPSLTSAIENGRRIYRSLGDWQMVARLYEVELELSSEPRNRAPLLLALGRVQAERLGDYRSAVLRLSEAQRMADGDSRIAEALAGVLVHPDNPDPDGAARAAEIFLEIAHKHLSGGDPEAAANFLRRALGANPDHTEAAALLEKTYEAQGRWEDLDRFYRQRLAEASPEAATRLLAKRAQLAETRTNNRPEAKRLYEEALANSSAWADAGTRLAQLYTEDAQWAELAQLKERALEQVTDGNIQLALDLELAALYAEKLEDWNRAAPHWARVLEQQPRNETAFTAYAEYLRRKHDYRALADLYEFTLEAMAAANEAMPRQVQLLEELADLAEKRLGDVPRAVGAWKRIEEILGGQPTDRTRDALKRLMAKAKMWEGLIGVLEKEARDAVQPGARADVLKRMAQVYREKQVDPQRAIALYEEALEITPQDMIALRALADLHERSGDLAGYARVLRRMLVCNPPKIERLNLLRKLAQLYTDKIGDVEDAAWACTEILEAVPGDRDALSRLEDALEKSRMWPRLLKTLEYHAETAATPAEKVKILKRVARLADDELEDEMDAMVRWEAVRKLAPDDADALAQLGLLYHKMERYADLVTLLERRLHRVPARSPEHIEVLHRLARTTEDKTNEPLRALKAWQKVVEITPGDHEALGALARLLRSHGGKDTRAQLADVLGKLLPLEPDPPVAAALALERARVLTELGQPKVAIEGLEHLLAEVDPRNLSAHALLRQLYEREGEFAKALRIAERELFLCADPDTRIERGMEIAQLWHTKLHDVHRTAQAYERVLEQRADYEPAQRALAPLYLEMGESERYLALQERRTAAEADSLARQELLVETAEAAETAIKSPTLAFEWRRRVYENAPGPEPLSELVALAERHALWEEMISFYDRARASAQAPAPTLEAARKISEICERKLGDAKRALAVLRDALPMDPEGRQLLGELERLADVAGDPQALLDIYARVGRARGEAAEKVELLRLRAIVREERLQDASGAMDEHLLAFALLPEDETTREQLVRLAEATGRWEDLLRTEAQRFARAADTSQRLTIARRAATIVETKLADRVRAFRAYLNAFRLAPEDEEILGHVWRLAKDIGEYAPAQQPSAASARTAAARPSARRDATQEISLADIQVVGKAEPTLELDGSLLSQLMVKPETERTMELSTRDLSKLVVEARRRRDVAPPGLTPAQSVGGAPSLPGARPPARPGTRPPPSPREALASGGVVAAPQSNAQSSGPLLTLRSAWEELALAYETLPADGDNSRIDRLLKIADVWARGAGDLDRAFGALERAFRVDADHPDVQAALSGLAEHHKTWDRVCAIYLRLAEEGGSAQRNLRLHLDAAEIWERQSRPDLAEERYHAALAIDPSNERALGQLEQIYRTSERWVDLAALLERRTTGLLERLPPGPQRTAALRELATLQETRLGKPYEAIESLARLAQETPGDVDVYATQARLYRQLGLWAKVVDALAKEAELADLARAQAARRAAAEIYEQQLELPDRAMDLYRIVAEQDSEDNATLVALDRLYETMGRFADLDWVLGRRAARAEGQARTELIVRRACLLDQKLRNPEASATLLKELHKEQPGDAALTDLLVENLRRAGRHREIAALLAERVTAAEAAGAPPTEVAALLVELGVLRGRQLEDSDGARKTFERALSLVPDYPSALAELARLHLGGADYGGYAKAREREAEVAPTPARAAVALVEAANVYKKELGDRKKALDCLMRAHAADPTHSAALAGLVALAEEDGRFAEAHELGRKRLDFATTEREKAEVLVAMAKAVRAGAGTAEEARALLEESLALAPDLLAGVEGLTDMDFAEGRFAEAERLLSRALETLQGDPESLGKLHYRLGECFDRLGKADEGYRALLEADRQTPGQLMIRLALGENRYRSRRWREAASYLGAVGEHKDAAKYADQVAQALVHAAESEGKMRRPERVPGLYEAALRVKPDCADALHALGELAEKSRDRAGAAAFAEREGAARGDPALLERAGDAWADLGDTSAARRAYERAIVASSRGPEGPGAGAAAMRLYEKALPLQRDASDLEAAEKTACLMIEAETTPKARAARRRLAAALAHARGNVAGALEHWTRALDDHPEDETSLLAIGEFGDPHQAVTLFTRVINHLPEPEPDADSLVRRAALWERLGLLRRNVTKDPPGAIAALEHAIAIDPQRRPAREALAELYGDVPEHATVALANHRALLDLDILRVPSLRAIAHLYATTGDVTRASCVYPVLGLIAELTPEEQAWQAAHAQPVLGPDDAYPGTLDEADHAALAPEAARALSDVFQALYEGAPTLFERTFESFGCTPQDRVSPVSNLLAGRIFGQVARALGNKKTGLYLKKDPGSNGIAVISQPPTGVLMGTQLAEQTAAAELRFLLGRALELTRPEYIWAATTDPKEFAQLFAAVLRAFHPRHSRRKHQGAAAEMATKLKKLLPYSASKRLIERFSEQATAAWSSASWRSSVWDAANRMGLVASGDIGATLRLLLREHDPGAPANPSPEALAAAVARLEPLRALLTFALSERYFAARAKLLGNPA